MVIIHHLTLEFYLNHGSYGATLKSVSERKEFYYQKMQLNPLRFLAREMHVHLNQTIEKLAKYVNADKDDIVLIENASTAVNSVLRSQKFQKNDQILVTSLGYNAVKTTLDMLKDKYEINVITVEIPLPTTSQDIVNRMKKALDENIIKFVIIDHISSFPSLEFPIKELITLTRERNILMMIDAAHSLGQVPLNLKDLDPDYFLANGHKWLCSSHGSAFLYVRKSLQKSIHPAVISHFYKQGFQTEFGWTGTRDYSHMISLDAALEFREKRGDQEIRNYNNRLCRSAAEMLIKRWNTSTIAPFSMMNSLVNIRLPCNTKEPKCWTYNIEKMQREMEDKYNIWTFLRSINGIYYVRISCQIYNEMSEYIRFAQILEELQNKPWL